MEGDIEAPEILIPIKGDSDQENLSTEEGGPTKKLKSSTSDQNLITGNDSTESADTNGTVENPEASQLTSLTNSVGSSAASSAAAVATRASNIMDTLTYENCSAAFFTSNQYTNPPYHILGVKYDDEEAIKEVIRSRAWFTYRRNFPALPGSDLQSDAGWGCAVRVGQMLLAECYKRLRSSSRNSLIDDDLLAKFHDLPTCPFSLHNLVSAFAGSDASKVGTWLGPNNVCHSIKSTVATSNSQGNNIHKLPHLQVHVCMDSTIAVPEIPVVTVDSPLLILIPLRLGLDEINIEMYAEDLKSTLAYPQSLGIIGGRPRFAYYFFGYSESSGELLALDPHTVKDFTGDAGPDTQSHICESPLLVPSVDRLDPSMALGFLTKNQLELDDLIQRLDKSRLCAVMKSLPSVDFGGDLDCEMPDTDDEFEILCP